MKIKHGYRCTGKTEFIIEEVLRNKGILLVSTLSECHNVQSYIYSKYKHITPSITHLDGIVMTLNQFNKYKIGRSVTRPVYIDNVDMFLQGLLGVKIEGVTITKE